MKVYTLHGIYESDDHYIKNDSISIVGYFQSPDDIHQFVFNQIEKIDTLEDMFGVRVSSRWTHFSIKEIFVDGLIHMESSKVPFSVAQYMPSGRIVVNIERFETSDTSYNGDTGWSLKSYRDIKPVNEILKDLHDQFKEREGVEFTIEK